jgi:SPP1 gp7 family putative phage head morphogenesis protein
MNSRDYWAAREAEALKHYVTDEREYQKQLHQIYQNMLDNCQKEIDSFYGKYAAAEGITIAEAKKRVAQHDVKAFERKAAKYVKEKDFSQKANEELRLYNATMKINRLEMLKANLGLEMIAGHDEIEKFMGGILKGRTEDELKRQAGILGKTVRNNAQKANAIVNGSFHNATFSDRIWQYQDLMKADLSKLLQSGLIQGKGARALAKDLRKYWYGNDPLTGGGAQYCMERLMRTELARVQTEAQKQSFERNGFDMYEFIVNGGCCPICREKDGKHFKVAKMMPGENAPPMHPNCRCSTAAWEDSDEYEAWLDYLDNGGTTVEWNRRIQIEAPGSTKSYKRSLQDIARGKAGLDKRRQNILSRLPNSGDYHRFEREYLYTRDLAYLSAATGNEFALFRSKHEDILIRGDKRTCNIVGELGDEIIERKYEWIAHSHVDGGNLAASLADMETLKLLGQLHSIIVGLDGEEVEFYQSPFGY